MLHKTDELVSVVVHLIVSLTQSRVTWEERLNEILFRLGWIVSMPIVILIMLIDVGKPPTVGGTIP